MKRSIKRGSRIAIIFFVIMNIVSCASHTEKLLRGGELAKALPALGWIPVDLPRELLGPGSIVSISDVDGIRYRGSLSTCLQEDAIKIRTFRAALPNSTKKVNLTAKGFVKFNTVLKLQPDFNKVENATLNIGKVNEVVLDEILLTKSLKSAMENFDSVCRDYFLAPNVYIITSALQVSDYTYTLFDKNNIKIDLSLDKLKNYVDFGANAKYDVTAEGSIKTKEPLYIAFKTAKYITLENVPGISPREDVNTIMQRYHRNNEVEW